eukprot:1161840-Pelagomonas_calceolata.AAC.6
MGAIQRRGPGVRREAEQESEKMPCAPENFAAVFLPCEIMLEMPSTWILPWFLAIEVIPKG